MYRVILSFGSLLLVLVGFTALAALATNRPAEQLKQALPTAKFAVGDCFHLRADLREPWETGEIALGKIDQVGKRYYLTHRVGSLYQPVDGRPLAIEALDIVAEKAGCPK